VFPSTRQKQRRAYVAEAARSPKGAREAGGDGWSVQPQKKYEAEIIFALAKFLANGAPTVMSKSNRVVSVLLSVDDQSV
jgi:hypothetical protein